MTGRQEDLVAAERLIYPRLLLYMGKRAVAVSETVIGNRATFLTLRLSESRHGSALRVLLLTEVWSCLLCVRGETETRPGSDDLSNGAPSLLYGPLHHHAEAVNPSSK